MFQLPKSNNGLKSFIYIYIDQELIFLTHIEIKTKRLTIIKIGGGLTH
jgi:hypothetical protein